MTKKIYLWPIWWGPMGRDSIYQGLMSRPPEGYEFVYPVSGAQVSAMSLARKARLPGLALNALGRVVPVTAVKARMERFRRVPADIDLIYAMSHTVSARTPWVMDLEHITYLVDNHGRRFSSFKKGIERALASPYCKKVLCYSDFAMKGVLANLVCPSLEAKVGRLPNAVPPRSFTKTFDSDRVKVLFVASANTADQFYIKGGPEALAAFELVSQRYDNVEMVMRTDVPPEIKARYRGLRGMRIIEDVIPWEALEREWKTAAIFLLPAQSPPFLAFLDAMSYELPVVTIDAPGNAELVEDGKTGFVAPKSEHVPYFKGDMPYVPDYGSPQFEAAIEKSDPQVARGIADRLGRLIESAELRRRMGKAGRWEVEQGRFSIEHRNAKLKRIFDEATAGSKAGVRLSQPSTNIFLG